MTTEICQGCKYLRLIRHQHGKYLGCYQGANKGMWIAQIEKCPISGGRIKKDTELEEKVHV